MTCHKACHVDMSTILQKKHATWNMTMTVYRPRCGTVRGPYCGPAPKSKKHCQGTDEYQNGASYVDHLQLLLYTFGFGAGGVLLYLSVLVPGLTAIHFCSSAGACCYTFLALVPGLAAIHFRSGAGVCCYQVGKKGHGRTKCGLMTC